MLTPTYFGLFIIFFSLVFLVPIYLFLLRPRLFDKYFRIDLDENYNLDDLFPIKIKGRITPKVDYLDIPYESLSIEIKTRAIHGTIINNSVSLELINLHDRKKIPYLIKQHYIKAVQSSLKEIIKQKKDYIELIKISKKQEQQMKKIACATCRYRIQCHISFNECNYEREKREAFLSNNMLNNENKKF